jgi:hypothetical protein
MEHCYRLLPLAAARQVVGRNDAHGRENKGVNTLFCAKVLTKTDYICKFEEFFVTLQPVYVVSHNRAVIICLTNAK